jgi:HAD superfamily hydrolase (TIGR01509 family)
MDLDGVLIHSHQGHVEAYARAFRAHGLELNPAVESWVRTGRAREEILRRSGVPDAMLDPVSEAKEEAFLRLLADGAVPPAPGARAFLERVRDAGRALALVSNSENASATLESLGIAGLFQAVVDGTMAPRRKPAPDPWLLGASLLELPPSVCIAVEDSVEGATGAREAGIFVAGVGDGLSPEEVDALYPDLPSIPLNLWLKRRPEGAQPGAET